MTTIDLAWVRSSHPNDAAREIAEVMLDAGDDPVAQAERLGEFLERDRADRHWGEYDEDMVACCCGECV